MSKQDYGNSEFIEWWVLERQVIEFLTQETQYIFLIVRVEDLKRLIASVLFFAPSTRFWLVLVLHLWDFLFGKQQ